MRRTSRYIVRMAIVLMLFQFLCPAFIPSVVQEITIESETAFHEQHSPIDAPTLLKEKDEKEESKVSSITESAPILDFTIHSLNLAVSHNGKHSKFAVDIAVAEPSRLALFCTLII